MKKIFFIGCLILIVSCQSVAPTSQIESTPSNTATVTPTKVVEPTATLLPSPTPMPLFFTEEFNTDLSAWSFFQTGGAQSAATTLENDSLRVELTSPNSWHYAIHNAHEYSNVFVSAKFSASPSGSVGLVCDYNPASGWYEFNVASDRTYTVLFGQWLADGVAQYAPIADNPSEYLNADSLNYEIGMTCGDGILLLYINGKMFRKIDVAHYGLTQGKIGIAAASFDDVPMTATFEWVKVSAPQ